MPVSNQLKNQHLAWRTGFGPRAADFDELRKTRSDIYLKKILQQAQEKPVTLNVVATLVEGYEGGIEGVIKMAEQSKEKREEIQKRNREGIRSLNLAWLRELIGSNAQLREKTAFFWHGHFACRVQNVYYQQLLLDAIRQNALGNFGNLLRAVSQSAAMINFLNNQQNRKKHPNENFAREVMELFTLGRGNYTEQDVKEAARAFTGWGANAKGDFVYRTNQHDDELKTILGKTGRFTGDDVINMLLEQKQTAKYITTKLWRFFVNENVTDEEKINWLSNRFYTNGYDISALLNDIFSASWFYDAAHIGSKIKSPIELLAGINRLLPMKLENDDIIIYLQRVLGQQLFFPPNVAGWPGGRQWIDSSTLIVRLRLPRLIADADEFAVNAKDDDDMTGGMREQAMRKLRKIAGGRIIKADINWPEVEKGFAAAKPDMDALLGALLQTPATALNRNALNNYTGQGDNFLRSAIINIMSTPEYQLC